MNKLTKMDYKKLSTYGFTLFLQGKSPPNVYASIIDECKRSFGFFMTDMQAQRTIDAAIVMLASFTRNTTNIKRGNK